MLIIVIITVCHQHSLTSVFIVASSLLYYKMCQFLSKTTFMPHSDSGFCLISIHPSSTAPMGFFFSSKKTRTALLGHIQEASFHTEELSLLQIAQLLTPSQSVSPITCNKTRENYRTQKLFTALEGGTRRINTTLGNWFILVAKQSILFTKICIHPFNVAEQKNYTIMVGRHELLHPWVSNSVPELWSWKVARKRAWCQNFLRKFSCVKTVTENVSKH